MLVPWAWHGIARNVPSRNCHQKCEFQGGSSHPYLHKVKLLKFMLWQESKVERCRQHKPRHIRFVVLETWAYQSTNICSQHLLQIMWITVSEFPRVFPWLQGPTGALHNEAREFWHPGWASISHCQTRCKESLHCQHFWLLRLLWPSHLQPNIKQIITRSAATV